MHMETLVVLSNRDSIKADTHFHVDDKSPPNRSASATLRFVSQKTVKHGGWSEHEIRFSMHDPESAEMLVQELSKIVDKLKNWINKKEIDDDERSR